MTIDEKYIHRCLQLALNGKGYVSPNPMVGAVVVHNGKIIGEGYHRQYGQAHAEVNAINSVKDKSLLKDSTIYVSLEPCSHYGKTPPCSQLIIDSQIPRVVVACLDPFPAVAGRGIEMLRKAGIDVTVGVLEYLAKQLNKEFITAQTKNRPYIYLKWAQSQDGFIDRERTPGTKAQPTPISGDFTKMIVHKLRSEVSSIMVGTNTVINDNPSLTTRLWAGRNPIRVTIDRKGRIPKNFTLFDGNVKTLVFTESVTHEISNNNVTYIPMDFDSGLLPHIFAELRRRNINSVLIEGGQQLLQGIIDHHLWDEAYIETAPIFFEKGVPSPLIKGKVVHEYIGTEYKHTHLICSNNKIT